MRILLNDTLNVPACPSKDWIKRSRIDRTLELAKDFDAKGAIVIYRKSCDPHKLDIPSMTKEEFLDYKEAKELIKFVKEF